jgi:hypothetical protein
VPRSAKPQIGTSTPPRLTLPAFAQRSTGGGLVASLRATCVAGFALWRGFAATGFVAECRTTGFAAACTATTFFAAPATQIGAAFFAGFATAAGRSALRTSPPAHAPTAPPARTTAAVTARVRVRRLRR